MIRVTVRFFAALREAVGRESLPLELESSGIEALRQALQEKLTEAQCEAVFAPEVKIAVNQNIIHEGLKVEDGDEVAFLPPVTGG